MPDPKKPSRRRGPTTAFVPRIVFQAACISVVPACALGCGTSSAPADSAADAGFRQDNVVIALAVQAFDADASADASGD